MILPSQKSAALKNPLEGVLEGVRLIEASAGTGKTHTLVSLYLRLLLEKHLELDKILVVTFTNAATEELRARIRVRLLEAVAFLRGERAENDAFLMALLEKLGNRKDMIHRISDTLARMEEAAVFTVHGFCRRMLQEYAFESGVLFDVTFITEESSLRREVITDFWRSHCPELDAETLRVLLESWETPAALLEGFKAALNLHEPRILPNESELGGLRDKNPARGEVLQFLISAFTFLKRELPRRKENRQSLFFDDLLSLLARALAGSRGADLSKAIRARFPVALIDEFQDTDPLQYEIFRKIYGKRNETFLCLIGDPKQAIYSFRGADVFTYMRAQQDAGDKSIYTMRTNWRSTESYVRGVNTLFSLNPAAFVYERHIRYFPVETADKNKHDHNGREQLLIGGNASPSIRIRYLSAPTRDLTRKGLIRVPAARKIAAKDCAAEIARILALSKQGKATLGDRAVQAGDIAVLVRTHAEGEIVQAALRRVGITGATLSQDSVFKSNEAGDIQTILQAVMEPYNERRLRAALATELFGWSAREILELEQRPSALEEIQERFYYTRNLWQTRGFLVAFFNLLKEEKIPVRARSLPEGERCLTNSLHLAELLHAASRRHAGMERLLRWFAEQRLNGDITEERQLRLESDASLVKIVTIHKSKGLEYPIVFFPFPWACKPRRLKGKGPVLFHDEVENSIASVDFGSENYAAHKEVKQREELAELVRLIYVAVTRARHLCVMSWGPVNEIEKSAMARVLGLTEVEQDNKKAQAVDPHRARLEGLAANSGGSITVEDAAEGEIPRGSETILADAEAGDLKARVFQGTIRRNWRLASYSSLIRHADAETPDYALLPEDGEPEAATGDADPVFLFPKGPVAGECLHKIFESLDFTGAGGETLKSGVAGHLERYGFEKTLADTAVTLVGRVLDTPLDGAGLCLRGLPDSDRLNELEFHFPISGIAPEGLSRVLDRVFLYRNTTSGLSFEFFQGIMKGFVDMVFRFRGRYYIVDYKSNHLGNRFEDYRAVAIHEAMDEHRYHLQYLIYTVALHRYLAAHLPGYAYDRHFGGVYYLFIRGMRPENGCETGVFYHRPDKSAVRALDDFFAGRSGRPV